MYVHVKSVSILTCKRITKLIKILLSQDFLCVMETCLRDHVPGVSPLEQIH